MLLKLQIVPNVIRSLYFFPPRCSQIFDCHFALFFSLMALHGIVLPQVIDDVSFVLLHPVIFRALSLNDRIDPLFFLLFLAIFLLIFTDIELRFELVIQPCHVHLLLMSHIDLEDMVLVLLSL